MTSRIRQFQFGVYSASLDHTVDFKGALRQEKDKKKEGKRKRGEGDGREK